MKNSPFDKEGSIPLSNMKPWEYIKAYQKAGVDSVQHFNDLNDILYTYKIEAEANLILPDDYQSYSQMFGNYSRVKEICFNCLISRFNPKINSLEGFLYLDKISNSSKQVLLKIEPEITLDKDNALWNIKFKFKFTDDLFKSLKNNSKLIFLSRLKIDQTNYSPALTKDNEERYIGCRLSSDYNLFSGPHKLSVKQKTVTKADFKIQES